MKIKFVDVEALARAENTSDDELKERRNRLTKEASHWMKKIAKLNSLYSGKILKIQRQIEALERILE